MLRPTTSSSPSQRNGIEPATAHGATVYDGADLTGRLCGRAQVTPSQLEAFQTPSDGLMGNSPSSTSPLTLEPPDSPLSSRSTTRGVRAHSAPAQNTDSTDTPAPPPYTPVAQPQEVPPPVPPRDANRVVRPHRRTASHEHRSSRHSRTPGTASADSRAPGDGIGGFISPQQLHPGSFFTKTNSIATRPQGATTSTRTNATSRATLTSRSSSGSTSNVEAPTGGVGRVQGTSAPPKPTRQNSKENPLDLLRKFDTVIIVDDSSSMEGALWREARDALGGIADAAARYGMSGIDLHFLNDRLVGTKLKSARDVKRLFDQVTPLGITPTGEKLEELLLDYLLRLEASDTTKPKPVNFVILTDGAPTDDPESVIVTAAKRLDSLHAPISQVGIQFVQLGSDTAATEALQELDDELANKHNIRDMVDTTPYSGQQLTTELLGKILLGGINRRVDKIGFHV